MKEQTTQELASQQDIALFTYYKLNELVDSFDDVYDELHKTNRMNKAVGKDVYNVSCEITKEHRRFNKKLDHIDDIIYLMNWEVRLIAALCVLNLIIMSILIISEVI